MSRLLVPCLLALLCSCAASEPFELNFPSQDTFLRTETAEIYVIPVTERSACPDLLQDAEVGGLAAEMTTGQRTVCEFRAGQVEIPDVAEGLTAYVAVAQGAGGTVFLSGCTVRDVYTDPDTLVITLSPTDDYRSRYPASTPSETCTVETKCALGC